MVHRDDLKKEALTLRMESDNKFKEAEEASKALINEAKKIRHSAIIRANQMEKEADLIQEALNEELEMEVKETNEANKAWDFQSYSDMASYLKEIK